MEHDTPQTWESDPDVVTVSTNSFFQVLEHFDDHGMLINPKTRFDIQCIICLQKNLAIVNPDFDKRSRRTHECYTVLPRCGHAFGYTCIYNWLKKDMNMFNPKCPICRRIVFHKGRQPEIFSVFGDSGANEQFLEILDIRKAIEVAQLETVWDGPDVPTTDAERLQQFELQTLREVILQTAWENIAGTSTNPAEQLAVLDRNLLLFDEESRGHGNTNTNSYEAMQAMPSDLENIEALQVPSELEDNQNMELSLSDIDEEMLPYLDSSDLDSDGEDSRSIRYRCKSKHLRRRRIP
ncbi:hypothetical protein F4776DRAFT_603854 [Hypoxylon sp. NC0597]|nr:hypothetical protein F4776DRAFT_603854 [Hypoxylon sp. NC0597]